MPGSELSRRTLLRYLCWTGLGGVVGNSARTGWGKERNVLPGECQFLPQESEIAVQPIITTMAIAAKAGLLAIGGDDHLLRIYNLQLATQMCCLRGHTDWVRAAVFTGEDRQLITGGNDGRILLWREGTLQPETIRTSKTPCTALVTQTGGKWVAALDWNGETSLFDTDTGSWSKPLATCGPDALGLAIAPNDTWLAVIGGRGRVMIWNLESRELMLNECFPTQRLRAVEFSPDGKYLAVAGDQRQVYLLPLGSEQTPRTLSVEGCKIHALSFVSSHDLAIAGTDGKIRLWNVQSPSPHKTWQAHSGTITCLRSESGNVISASYDANVTRWSLRDQIVAEAHRQEESISPAEIRLGARPNLQQAREY